MARRQRPAQRSIALCTRRSNRPIFCRRFSTRSSWPPLDHDSALAYLTTIVSDLLSSGNNYFLPIEAVAEVVKKLRKPDEIRDLVETVDLVRLNEFAKTRSEYGPVRNATDFEPPDEESIEENVARRFNPIIGIFK